MTEVITTKTTCNLCGDEKGTEGCWAKVQFKSKQYLYDDGTHGQDYAWDLCRECKGKLVLFMTPKLRAK